ncbi:hypothetical protein EIP91_007666 [Steccherinum ochraceum]|uniref:Cryptic loci regulator 2 N-terminal domain-containing protein n=1 Tax=Steccherinum ochraceum TaxID=92696 RepID=A0A4R0RE80_9APHY|nr:hypothetical protein EIP91_007666 [Steccherinum ochraceum]
MSTHSTIDDIEYAIRSPHYDAFTEPAQSKLLLIRLRGGATGAIPNASAGRRRSMRLRAMVNRVNAVAEGFVNHYEPAPEEDVMRWKRGLGQLAVKHYIKGEMKKRGRQLQTHPDRSVLVDFPAGYTLYVHLKGPANDPRKDCYLLHSTIAHRFRSPAEFFLHLIWLMKGKPWGRDKCECKYCKPKRTQTEIGEQYDTGYVRKPRITPPTTRRGGSSAEEIVGGLEDEGALTCASTSST